MTAALLLVVLGATAANATTQVVSVTSASVGRDATSKFTFDVMTTTDAVQGAGRVCTYSQYTCTLVLSAQLVDGATVDLQSATIAWGATFPYSHEFLGTLDTSRVIAVRAYIQGYSGTVYGNWTLVTDPLVAPVVSVTSSSVGRDGTSKFTFDVTATADGVQGAGRVCTYSQYACTMALSAQLVDGSTIDLQSMTIAWGATFPSSHEFSGSIDTSTIVAVRAYVQGYSGIVYSNWAAVSDPLTAPVISISGVSIGRDASSHLTFDVTATAGAVEGVGRVCSYSQYTCSLLLSAQLVDGSTVELQSATIAWGATFPYSHEFSGTLNTSKVIAIRASAQGYSGSVYGNWTPVTDPLTTATGSTSVSVSVNSVGRDASTDKLTYNLSVSVPGTSLSTGPCGGNFYHCYLYVQTLAPSGDIMNLASTDLSSATSYGFTGTAVSATVTAFRAYTGSYYNPTPSYSSWAAANDPYPSRSVTVPAGSIGREASTGKLTYNLSVSASGTSLPDGPCGGNFYHCYLYLQALSPSGDITNLASSDLSAATSYNFVGTTSSTKVNAIRAYTSSYYNPSNPFYSTWATVTDPYPDRSVTIPALSIGREASTGKLVYNLGVSVSGTTLTDGPCGGNFYHCFVFVQTRSQSGDITTLATSDLSAQSTYPLSGSVTSAKVTAIRAYASSYYYPSNSVYSSWYPVHDGDKSDSTGGGNSSLKGCTCHNGDPVNTQTGEFYENLTDLELPGVGPAVAVGRTYSSVNAAVNGPFGYGWSSTFGSQLVVDTDGDSTDPLPRQVHVVQENGATVPFTENGSGLYPSAPWVLATLTHSTSTGNWTFTRDKKQVFIFDSSGTLISTSDLHGNTVTYGYTSGHVSSISGSGGREIDLTWTSGRVSAIADSAGRAVAFGYDSAGNLTVVDAADNGLWGYTYDSSHRVLTETRPGGGVTTNVYNGTGQVTSQSDPVGRVTTFAYSGLSTTVTLPGGSITTYTFNQGQPASVTTATGTALAATTTYSYDDAGNLASQTDPLGHVTTYTYDSAGNALTSTDPLGKVTTRTYDSLRDVTSVEDPLGRTTTMTYNADGDLTSSETPEGHTTTVSYHANGTVATSTDARGMTTSYTYDSAGRLLCVTDPDSRQTCQTNDGRGLATTQTDAAGKVTTMTYDDAGRVLTTTDPNSHTTTYVYDSDGNLTSTQDASGHTVTTTYDHADQRTSSTDGRGKTTSYTYTPRGSVATVTDPNGHVTTNAYDAQDRLTSSTDAASRVTSFAYDLAGEKISTTLPSTAVSSSTYDADGRVATTTDALGKVTIYAYDDAGELHSTTDPLSRVTTYNYTDDGKLHVTTLPDSSTETYAYDENDVQTSFTNADGDVTTYSYDDAGLLNSETQPGGMTTSFTYDSAGRIHTVTTPDGVVATRTYDDGGRLSNVNYPGTADDVSYTYFANGSRHTMTDGTGTTTYAYNANAALTSVQNGNGQTIGYGYDDASQLTSITYPGSKTVSYGYDDAGNMTSVTDWASRTTTLTVTADGLQNTRADPSGVTETRSYNANDQLTDISSATSSATLSDYGYGYDDAGQLTSSSLTDAIHTTTATNAWGYTSLGQLSSTGPSTGYTTTPAGELTATPAGDAFTYNSKQELASATNTSAGTTTAYSFNDNGSRTETATTTSGVTATVSYDYDARGNLTSVSTGGTTVSYQSDGDGLRQSRTVGTTTSQFLWDPNHAIPLLLDDGTDSYVYATSTTPIAQIDDSTGAIEYLHADNVGSVRTITSATGIVVGTPDYNSYGAVTSHTGTSTSNFGYATSWTDPNTGLDYLRAREYDPATAQFLQFDPAIDQTRQPYEYVAGDPTNANDPTGLCIGMDGTPKDRACTQNDFFWAGLNDHLGAEFKVAGAGFVNGALGGIPNDLGWTCSSLQSDNLYWAEYAIGGVVTAAASGVVGKLVTPALKALALAMRGGAGAASINEGVYIIRTELGTYVGQSGNIALRFASHLGRFSAEELANAERIAVAGGKTAREIVEQLTIDAEGGVANLLNKVNPIGTARVPLLMPPGYVR